jgi:uncharacterized protein YjiS (DUF1127 family)
MTSAALNTNLGEKRRWNAGARVVGRAVHALKTWRRRQRTIHVLMGLDDHTLKDIGLHRSEILSVANHLLVSRHARWRP